MRVRWVAVLTAGALALAGCGREVGADDGGDGAAATDAAGAEDGADDGGAEQPQAVECEEGETDGDLLFYNWSDYMDPDLLTAFGEEFGVTATEDNYTSNEALLAQIRAGGADYDVIVPSDYMVAIMIEEGVLLPLDKDAVPNASNVDEAFAEPPYDPDLTYTLPYQWGTTGIGVDLEATGPDPEATWGWLFDPDMAGDLSISMLDDPRETIGAALYYLGYDPNTQSEEEIQEAADLVAEADWVTTFTSDQYPELLLTGETEIGHGYSGNILDNIYGADDPDRYAYLIPEEGATIWTDNMAILGSSQHPCTAHAFINFILDAENGAQLTNWTFYASPNAAATEFIDEEVLEDPAIYPDEDVRENLYFLENTGESEILYTDLFTRAQG
ncbi:MAG: spermidine/putrescine ABC transporter substrate-binding protein [Nitriliruptor sp.]|uniref:spermidine/putrescine ABC transporter substrate-binding protein n=1 Tax=Nitriliruptor sp. TaxID=2448056 RepID=UPI0034A092DB